MTLVASYGADVWSDAKPICSVISKSSLFDGVRITTKGTLHRIPHGFVFSSSDCPNVSVEVNDADNYSYDETAKETLSHELDRNRYARIDVVVSGVFRKYKDGQWTWSLYPYSIEIDRLIAAKPKNNN